MFSTESKKRQCKVLFEYTPQNEDELELKLGDVIDINEEVRLFTEFDYSVWAYKNMQGLWKNNILPRKEG